MKYIRRVGIITLNLVIGYISFWWFIFSCAAAFNVDNEVENEIFIPFGIISLLALFIGVIGGNLAIYKYNDRNIRGLVLGQVLPFTLGVFISLLLAHMRN
jgi:hypothetical protein